MSRVIFFFNEDSYEGAFKEEGEALAALGPIMRLHRRLRRFGYPLHVSPALTRNEPVAGLSLGAMLRGRADSYSRLVRRWMAQCTLCENEGAEAGEVFAAWDDHGDDLAMGAMLTCALRGVDGDAVAALSVAVPGYMLNPLNLYLHGDEDASLEIENFWGMEGFERYLETVYEPRVGSWSELERVCREFSHLIRFHDDAFRSLKRYPFRRAAARSLLHRLSMLSSAFWSAVEGWDWEEEKDAEFRQYFGAPSEAEKSVYRATFNFPRPDGGEGEPLPFHGQFQLARKEPGYLYFQWPPPKGAEKLLIVHVGSKLTEQ